MNGWMEIFEFINGLSFKISSSRHASSCSMNYRANVLFVISIISREGTVT